MTPRTICILVLTATCVANVSLGQEETGFQRPNTIKLVQYDETAPLEPTAARNNPRNASDTAKGASDKIQLPNRLLGSVSQIDDLPKHRRSQALSPAADAVFGAEAKGRVSNDVGDLLRKSISSHGVSTQDRTPIVTDTRIRGQRVGQVLASGSYWTPVRMDLDTMMNKIDSRLIENLIIIKGPYSTRYGPGFRFVDFDLIETPRFEKFESHGSTSFDYDTNGQQAYGRQSAWGGGKDWGFRVSYGHRTGNDYETGAGTEIPASYKSRDLFLALGWDATPDKHFEFNYLRLDQTDLEFPGLVFDLNFLITDGYELKYVDTAPLMGDRVDAEVWYNRTRFDGDTLRASKARQIPTLSQTLFSFSGNDGFAVTDGDGMSLGYRVENTFGHEGFQQFSVGADVTHLRQNLNDIEPLIPDPNDNNFPLPPSRSTTIGFFAEEIVPVNNWLTVIGGARADLVVTEVEPVVPGTPFPVAFDLDVDSLQQQFFLWSAFLSAEVKLNREWIGTIGGGFGQRPPTLTEMYTSNSFIGSLQRGLTALAGDPLLKEESLTQIDLGLRANYGSVRGGLHGYFSWIDDLITYDLLTPAGGFGTGGFPAAAAFVNTEEAIIAGFEAYGEADLTPYLTSFGTMSYIEGRDLTRNTPSRFGGLDRSEVIGSERESLPGITPLESRIGLRIHDPSPDQKWGLEFAARIVDNQDRVAASLEEVETPGFTTYDVRFFKRTERFLFTAGCENLTDKFYQEHLDYRSGLGVFRPGINFYSGLEVFY